MSRAEFEELGTEELIKYLATQKVMLSDNDNVQAIFREQNIIGAALLVRNKKGLREDGIPKRVASLVKKKVPQ